MPVPPHGIAAVATVLSKASAVPVLGVKGELPSCKPL